MNEPIQQAVITVTGIEQAPDGSRFKLTADDGNSYSFFTVVKTGARAGQQTQAVQDFYSMGVNIGSRIGVAYVLQANTRNPQYPYRTIRAITTPDSVEYNQNDGRQQYVKAPARVIPVSQPNKPMPNVPIKPQRDPYDEAFGRCRYGFLIEAYKMGKELSAGLVMDANEWAEAAMTGKTDNEIKIQDEEEINVENIPF